MNTKDDNVVGSLLFFGLSCLLMTLLLLACGDVDPPDENDFWRGNGANNDPPVYWTPGEKPEDDGCSYGYGEPCPRSGIDCDDSPCINGLCIRGQDGEPDRCECQEGYAGERCDTCADGYIADGLQCVPI